MSVAFASRRPIAYNLPHNIDFAGKAKLTDETRKGCKHMSNLLIKGGTVIDGTGSAGRKADVRVSDGRIAEVGPGLASDGEQVIEAEGLVVTPGFIDSHTHYDATIYWDPMLDPMTQHGVTTVVGGNCSLGLAPIRPADREAQIEVFSYLEDLPGDLLNQSIPWQWEKYGDYAHAASQTRLGLNLMTYAGHSQIRCYVMGEDAWTRTANADEIAAMVELLDEALAAGALGLSYSLFDKDREGRPVPSSVAGDDELDALIAKLGEYGATFQFVPGDNADAIIKQLGWLGEMFGRHGVTGFYNILLHMDTQPDRASRIIACLQELRDKGTIIHGMVSPRFIELSIGFEQSICFLDLPAWNSFVQSPLEAKRAMIDDPAWRARCREEADTRRSTMFPFKAPEMLKIAAAGNEQCREWIGNTLAELHAARGGHISDMLADWVKENDFDTSFALAIANTNADEVASLLKCPVGIISASDAGAHLQMFCAAGDSTLLLTKFVRERGDLSLEEAVHGLTARQAEAFRIPERGELAPGKVADITIFSLDELEYGGEKSVSDMPGGISRLTRDPGGYRYTIVAGEVVQQDGQATGALPASWLARAS
ncbi:MAG: amidohydrolase family protein [Novosphingobium sp.]|nr:amidohydrolase family protein [Novosphingobium sp.]